MAEGKSPKLVKRNSSVSIVKQSEVSLSEEAFHTLADNDASIIDEAGTVSEKNGQPTENSHKSGWDKIAKTVKLTAILNAAAPQLDEGGILELSEEDFRVGIPFRFKVHLEQLPGNTLIVTCDPSDGASIKIATHEKDGTVTYMCTILPLKEGKFTISTLFGKKHVLGSPFEVKFDSPAAASLCTFVEAPDTCRTSVDKDTLTFCVRTNQEREGTLTATAKSLSGNKAIPVTISESGKGHYDVEFDAKDGKKYRLSVKFDNQPINGSPFFLHLSDATLCKASGNGLVRGTIGQENHFEVATKGAGPGKLRVKVKGRAQAVVVIKPKEDDVYDVTYFPKKVGSYHVTVMWLNEEIPGSPFVVNCYKTVTVTPPKPEKSSVFMVGETYKFKIDAKECGEGKLEASCAEEDRVNIQVDVTNSGKGQYRVNVSPMKTGTALIRICWAEMEVPGSPFAMEVDCKPDTDQVSTSGPFYEVGSSKPVTLELNAEKGGAGKLKVTCAGEKSKNVPVKVAESQPKIHVISFEPPKPDIYTLWVTWSKKQIPGSPFTINLLPSSASACHIVGPPVVPENWEEPAVLTISTVSAGNGKLEAKAEGEQSGVLADEHVQTKENEAGETEVRLVAPTPNIYKLSVTWSGEEIPKSPFILNRIPPNVENCVSSVSRFGLQWQEEVNIYVDASTAGNGKLVALAVGDRCGDVSKCIAVTTRDNQLGNYVVKFTPSEPDTYTITVEWSGKPVPGFPCRLNRNRYQPEEVQVVEQPAGLLKVGQAVSVVVDTSRGGPGKLTSTCSIKDGGDIPAVVEPMEEEHKYKVYFTPHAQDIYSLSVLWSGKHIKGSPFAIDLVPVDASRVIASEPTFPQGLEGPVEVMLSTDDAGRAPVTAVCMGRESGRVPVTVNQISYSKFKLSFIPPNPDLFTMGVKYGNNNIKSSPFHINTFPPDATMVNVTSPEETQLGHTVNYLCDTSRAGYGKLSATVSGRKCGTVETSIIQDGVAKFTLEFMPQDPDVYSTAIKWEGEDVPGSPFLINLLPLDASLVKAEKVHIPDEAGSEYAYVVVDCSNVRKAALISSVLGETTGDITTETEELSNSCHSIKFIPPKDDKYTVSILFNNEDIPGSPFIMSIISPQPDKVKLVSTTIPNQVLPEVVHIFDTAEAGRGEMTASTRGERSGEVNNHEICESSPGTWKVSFIPPFPDTYYVSCFWAKREIPQSPFQVNLESAVASKVVVGELHVPAEAGLGDVWLDLNCSAAGHDVIRSTLEDTASFSNAQEAEIKSLGLKQYRLKVEPKEPGLYSFSVRYGRDHVQGSPFEVDLQLCVPEGVKVKEHCLPQYSDGREGYIILDTSEAGRGTLTARLSTERSHDSLPLKFEEMGKHDCKIIFTPPNPNPYVLEIFWSDIPIPSSPHNFTVLLPICPEKVVCGEIVGYNPGTEAKLNVSTYGAGEAALTATCKGEECGDVDVTVVPSETATDSYIVSFTPPIEDKYYLSVRYCGTQVPHSPFLLDLMLDPLKCFLFEYNELNLPICLDQEVSFGVNTTKGGAGKLRVTVVTPDEKPATFLHVTQPESGIYNVSYTPKTTGLHEISLEWGNGCIPGSPLQLNVQKPAVPVYYYGKPITIQVKRLQVTLNDITALATHVRSETHCDVTISQVKKDEFMLVFEAEIPGMYCVNIHQNGAEIEGSPYIVRYAPPANPHGCVVSNIASSTQIGKTTDFTLDASDAGFGEISVRPDIPVTGLDSTVNIRDNYDGSYIIQYKPQAVGVHRVHILWSGTEVPGSPFTINVDRPESSEGVAELVQGEEELFQELHATEKPVKFVIETPDGYSGKLAVSCHGPGKPELKIRDNKNRRYICTLVPNDPGNYWIHVLWKQRHIDGSPFLLNVIPKKATRVLGLNSTTNAEKVSSIHISEEDQCIFKGPQSLGTKVSFHLITRNAGTGELSVSCVGPGSPEVDLQDNDDGTHTCTLTVSEQGDYKVHVLWEKMHITCSPFSLSFLPPKAVQILGLNPCANPGLASNVSIAEEDKALFTKPQPVKPLQFNILTSAGGKGELCVSAKGPGEISVEMLTPKEEGMQTCLLSPSSPGEYCIYILWDKIHIPESPFAICFTSEKARKFLGICSSNNDLSRSHLARVYIIPEDLQVFSKPQTLHTPIGFRVSTKKAGKGVLTLTTQGPGKAKVTIRDAENHICVCTMEASVAGRYKINLLWNNEQVDEKPYELVFESKKRQVMGIDLDNIVLPINKTHTFKVFYKDIGEGNFELFCRPSTAAEIEVSPLSDDGCYHCKLTPLVAGNHDLFIQYKGNNLFGSPFCVHFHSYTPRPVILATPPIPRNIRVYGPGINRGSVHQEGNFVIDTSNAGLAKLDFEVVGPYGGFNAQLRQHWENEKVLLARYDPTIPGVYHLVMRWAGIEIPGSPFTVHITE